jgi:hypothetical protein
MLEMSKVYTQPCRAQVRPVAGSEDHYDRFRLMRVVRCGKS